MCDMPGDQGGCQGLGRDVKGPSWRAMEAFQGMRRRGRSRAHGWEIGIKSTRSHLFPHTGHQQPYWQHQIGVKSNFHNIGVNPISSLEEEEKFYVTIVVFQAAASEAPFKMFDNSKQKQTKKFNMKIIVFYVTIVVFLAPAVKNTKIVT